jgi:hypothetical protein
MATSRKRLSLVEKTRELLVHRKRTLTIEIIAKHLGCSGNWVSMFATGKIENPGANIIQELYELLAEKPLEY